eukprot:gene5001-6227_t
MKFYSHNYRDLSSSDEEYWRNNRSIVAGAFTKIKVKSNALHLVEKQTKLLLSTMEKFSNSGEIFYPRRYYKKFSMNIVLEYVYSRQIPYEESVHEGDMERLYKNIEKLFIDLSATNIDDFISWMGPPVNLYRSIVGTALDPVMDYIQKIYDEHVSTLDENNPRDIMDQMIIETNKRQVDPLTISLVSGDIFMAGTDTSSGTLEWFTLFMANYPEIQQKAYDELSQAFGKDTSKIYLQEEKDKVPYFNAVLKEVMRLRFIAPLGLTRCAKDDITIDGLFIPKGTFVMQNHTALLRSSDYWDQPEEFNPSRFFEPPKKYRYEDLCIPFSVGPRNCIGLNLANEEMFAGCANMLLNFEFKNPNPTKKIDDSEVFGLTIHPNEFGIYLSKRK